MMPDPDLPLLAVIVTAHNLERYIGACLESIARQSNGEIEIVVVDDGSVDGTVTQIEDIMRRYPQCVIRLITQSNQGVSAARNHGIAAAHAHYLSFVDGDDMWAPDFCDCILPVLRLGHVDMIEFDVEVVSDAGVAVDTIAVVPPGRIGAYTIDAQVLQEYVDIYQAFVWARVYRSVLWRNLRFPDGRHYEDNATLPFLYLLASTLYRIDRRLYRYRRRSGSITSVATLSTVQDLTLNAKDALLHSGDARYCEFWQGLFGKSFFHACSQAARIDAAEYPAALALLADLVRCYRTSRVNAAVSTDTQLSADRAIASYLRHVRLERTLFLSKRVIKRLLGRELKARRRALRVDRQTVSLKS